MSDVQFSPGDRRQHLFPNNLVSVLVGESAPDVDGGATFRPDSSTLSRHPDGSDWVNNGREVSFSREGPSNLKRVMIPDPDGKSKDWDCSHWQDVVTGPTKIPT